MLILLIISELGHYLAYRVLGYKAVLRRFVLIPGIDPACPMQVKRLEGLSIALGGFILSTAVVVIPLYLFNYRLWFVVLIISAAGRLSISSGHLACYFNAQLQFQRRTDSTVGISNHIDAKGYEIIRI